MAWSKVIKFEKNSKNSKNSKINNLKYKYTYVIFVAIVVLSVGYVVFKNILFPLKYTEYISKASNMYNVDPYIIYAIIKQESNFNKNACSFKNAKGLMQILDNTAKEVALDIYSIDENNIDLYDPEENIYIGVKYFSDLVSRYDGNIYMAVLAYNAGIGNVYKWFGDNASNIYDMDYINSCVTFGESKKYLTNVIKYYEIYRNLY